MMRRRIYDDKNERTLQNTESNPSEENRIKRNNHENRFIIIIRIICILLFFVLLVVIYFQVPSLSSSDTALKPEVHLLKSKSQKKEIQEQGPLDEKEKDNDDNANTRMESSIKTVTLTTEVGDIEIFLRPDLSEESVNYILKLAPQNSNCEACHFYRAENPGILQGIMKQSNISKVMNRGSCPKGFENIKNECPSWDWACRCHGPTMTRGMVAWAGGGTGPDFFIDNYKRPAKWWGTQHTGEYSLSVMILFDFFWMLI